MACRCGVPSGTGALAFACIQQCEHDLTHPRGHPGVDLCLQLSCRDSSCCTSSRQFAATIKRRQISSNIGGQLLYLFRTFLAGLVNGISSTERAIGSLLERLARLLSGPNMMLD